LAPAIARLKDLGIRTSLFVDYDNAALECARELGADRIELYTEPYAAHFGGRQEAAIWQGFRSAAVRAQGLGLGVNAGHDLNLENLARFLEIEGILEVSIGHAFVVECIEHGIAEVLARYASLTNRQA
jgi:pyridoxine 5-phosphate synthase